MMSACRFFARLMAFMDFLLRKNGDVGKSASNRRARRRVSPGLLKAFRLSDAAIIECVHSPLYFEDVFTGERKGLDFLQGKKVASLSGIAQPEGFEQSLVKLDGELVYSKRFADHHRFSQQEILNAINRAKKRQADIIITTQKDAVRFPKIDRRDLPFYLCASRSRSWTARTVSRIVCVKSVSGDEHADLLAARRWWR